MGYRSQAKLPHCTAKGPEDGDSGLLWGLQSKEGALGTKIHGQDNRTQIIVAEPVAATQGSKFLCLRQVQVCTGKEVGGGG